MASNRLSHETSPYLLGHADDPVDWWPWGRAALDEAKLSNRPILLSAGYSTCHWCHVMARESFRDPDIAARINRDFVAIKLDREERPDLDMIYQTALALMGQPGGWPLTLFLLPDGMPFWGGTYFPPVRRWGRPAFIDILDGIASAWKTEGETIITQAGHLRDHLAHLGDSAGGPVLSAERANTVARDLLGQFDPVHGGFGGPPKFPQPPLLRFLWRRSRLMGDGVLADAVILTLDRLCLGGIHDHLGGGFMRYATDTAWKMPHFEKMLYDNAQLISLMSEVWRHTRSPLYHDAIVATVAWAEREMTIATNAFAAALDADSDGEEGSYYLWSRDQIKTLFAPALTDQVCQLYEIPDQGSTLPHRNHPQGGTASPDLARVRVTLRAARDHRPRPARDDKVLADWNGLMIHALALAGQALERPDWIERASRALTTVSALLTHPDGRLAHVWAKGRIGGPGLVDDHAAMAMAAITLSGVSGESTWLERAGVWLDQAHRHHWDNHQGGYFQAAHDAADVPLRAKSSLDTVVPSGNAAMAEAMAMMFVASGEAKWRDRAEAVLNAFSGAIAVQGGAMVAFLDAWHWLDQPGRIVITGTGTLADRLTRTAVALGPSPMMVVRKPNEAIVQAIYCEAAHCHAPVESEQDLAALLRACRRS